VSWHPLTIESRSLASCSPRSLTSRRLCPGTPGGFGAPTSPEGEVEPARKRRPGEGLRCAGGARPAFL
jgi:hypothetical protein